MTRSPIRIVLLAVIMSAFAPRVGAVAQAQMPGSTIPPGYDDPSNAGYAPGRYAGAAAPGMPNMNNYGPMGPTAPAQQARPSSWPGGAQDPARGAGPAVAYPPQGAAPPSTEPEKSPLDPPYDPAAILARVGSEVIQANEVLPSMHQMLDVFLKQNADKLAQMSEEEKKEAMVKWQRDVLAYQLKDFISIKMLLTEVKNKFPAEQLKKNEERIRKNFNEEYIKELMGVYKVDNVIDLDVKLRECGSSLEAQRRVYVEKFLAVSWLKGQVRDEPEPTHEQMVVYYQEHAADWETPARCQWEQITAKFSQYENKQAAWRAIAQWGNDVIVRGVPFGQVAKAHSQDISAEESGHHDWTTKNSLRSERIDEAIFSLPVGAMSRIIEDEDGYHIVLVSRREEFSRAPFNEAQPTIKERMMAGDQQRGMNKYLEKLRATTPVWNRFEQPDGALAARPPSAPAR